MIRYLCTLFLAAILTGCTASGGDNVELGTVDWLRSYPEAVAKAKESGKPILILFQEVPG